MELKEVLLKRRSVRRYTEEAVTEEMLDDLMHAAMSGPSACNKMPWKFYCVTSAEVLAQLRKATRATNITAPAAIVVCGDLSKVLPEKMGEYWIQDCSAATENILLRAADLGLGTCWCGIWLQDQGVLNVKAVLGLGDELEPLNIIYVGHPAEEPCARDQYSAENTVYVK